MVSPLGARGELTPVNMLTEKRAIERDGRDDREVLWLIPAMEAKITPYRLILISSFKISSLVVITRELA